jgi:acetyltransferase EpsM
MSEIVIIGGRGNGTVIASTIQDCAATGTDIECVGFLNDDLTGDINGYPILGDIQNNDWQDMPDHYEFIYALSNVNQAPERYELLYDLDIPQDRYATVIHPTATVSNKSDLGDGVVVMPNTVVGPNVSIGNHTQLYAQSFVGHDTELGEMVFVANNASIGGRLMIDNGAHIGSNASILERLAIGEFAVVGLGSVVVDDVESYQKVVGNPAEPIGKL